MTRALLSMWVLAFLIGCQAVSYTLTLDIMTFNFEVVDEQGNPVPYVYIWGTSEDVGANKMSSQRYANISDDDLKRIATRYGEAMELLYSASGPVPAVANRPGTDGFGQGTYKLNYGEPGYRNINSHMQRFAFLKRGYLPTVVSYRYHRGDKEVTLNVTLKKDPSVTASIFGLRFDELRYQMEELRRHVSSQDINLNKQIVTVARQLTELGDQTYRGGEPDLAAKIYWYASDLPVVINYSTGGVTIKEFSMGERQSPEQIALADYALSLVVNEPNLKIESINRDGAMSSEELISAYRPIVENHKEQILPRHLVDYVGHLAFALHFKEACDFAVWLQNYEPKTRLFETDPNKDTPVANVNAAIHLKKKVGKLDRNSTVQCTKGGLEGSY